MQCHKGLVSLVFRAYGLGAFEVVATRWRVIVPLESIECWVYGNFIILYPKSYSA